MKWALKSKNRKALCITTVSMMVLTILFTIAPITVYAANNPLYFTVKQVFTATAALTDATFKYRLKPLDSSNPMPAGSTADGYTFTITGNGGVVVGPIGYSRQDIYRYEVFQVIDTQRPGYTYDKQAYTVEVYADAAIGCELIVKNNNGTKTGEIKFENRYNILPSDPNLMVDPPVIKTVFGNSGCDSTFTFKLAARDISYPMPSGSLNGIKTIYIAGSGRNEFGVWSYDKAGIYYYTVYEVNTGDKGYTYDTMVYAITDMVREETGRLVVSRVVTNAMNKQVTSLAFNNSYNPGSGATNPQNPTNSANPSNPANPANPANPTNPSNPNDVNMGNNNRYENGKGPKTGDDRNTKLYIILLVLSSTAAVCVMIYLIAGGKRKRKYLRRQQPST